MFYTAANWYWMIFGEDPTQVFSSASASLVPMTDSTYEAWLAQNNLPSRIGFTAASSKAEAYNELYGVLTAQAPTVASSVESAWTSAGYIS